jgi:hypothetical protein
MQRIIANNSHTGHLLEGEGDTAGMNTCFKFHESHGDWVESTADKMIVDF